MNTHSPRRGRLAALCAALALHLPLANADIVGTEAMTAPTPDDAERAKVEAFLERATVAQQLQAFGVDGQAASERVKAMTQAEVHTLAQRIDSLPAGGAFSTTDIVIIVLVVILLVVLL